MKDNLKKKITKTIKSKNNGCGTTPGNLVINYLSGILPTPGEAKAKAMPGRLYIHTK
jgi:hypothetical protein